MAVTLTPQFGCDVVLLLVEGDQLIDAARIRGINLVNEIREPESVDRDAQPYLRLNLVALRDSDITHVVAESCNLEAPGLGPSHAGPSPRTDSRCDSRVRRMTGHGHAIHAQSRLHERKLAIAMGCLVEVHVVHVDRRPRQLQRCLRVQVQEWLGQRRQPTDPCFRRREGVHPGDDAYARVVGSRIKTRSADRVSTGEDRLPEDVDRSIAGRVEQSDNHLRLCSHLRQDIGAVQLLASGQEPDLL
ncbi:unannotated protein [freshwater metagenome]|uniref:Unannotated protein n=1 Tax=freshwater metagenome TaxID=449393 RepID=A0A6J6T6V7_9ZZZZ